jgi:predicted phosphodiesterase
VEATAPRVLVVHHHLRENAPTVVGFEDDPTAPEGLMGPLEDARGLLDWAERRGVRLAFHGHKHNFWEPYEPRDGLLVLNSGTSTRGKAGRDRRARIVDLDAESGEVRVQALAFGD